MKRNGREAAETEPDQVIAMLQYALTDVRKLSERSARHLETAITTLVQDTSVVIVPSQSTSANH